MAILEQLGAELHSVGADLDESKDLAREHATANDLPFFEDGAEPAQFDGLRGDRRGDPAAAGATARAR